MKFLPSPCSFFTQIPRVTVKLYANGCNYNPGSNFLMANRVKFGLIRRGENETTQGQLCHIFSVEI